MKCIGAVTLRWKALDLRSGSYLKFSFVVVLIAAKVVSVVQLPWCSPYESVGLCGNVSFSL